MGQVENPRCGCRTGRKWDNMQKDSSSLITKTPKIKCDKKSFLRNGAVVRTCKNREPKESKIEITSQVEDVVTHGLGDAAAAAHRIKFLIIYIHK